MTDAGPAHPVEAVAAWHAALEVDDHAAEAAGWLVGQLEHRGLFFGERPLCTVLQPRFLSRAQYTLLQSRCAVLLQALGKTYRAALDRPELLAQFGLEPWELELLREDQSPGDPNPLSRVDAFFDREGRSFKVTELNGETPAGPAYVDALSEIFLAMPVSRILARDWVIWPLPVRHRVLQTLLHVWHRFSGRRETPAVAIVDWREVPTYSEFVLFQRYFADQGISCVIADPAELTYRDGRLTAAGAPVNLIYKRILLSELVQRAGLDHALVRAVRDRAVCLVNGFRCKLLHKKASLAVLSDPRNHSLFDRAELAVITEHVPWTRVVEERHTTAGGRDVDLVPFILRERERLVLKPNDEYGGTGVVLGWQVDDSTWERTVRSALQSPHIVQERIELPVTSYPAMVEGKLTYGERIADTAPFAFEGGLVDGCLTRVSTDQLVNVTAGGGSTMATFVVERRAA